MSVIDVILFSLIFYIQGTSSRRGQLNLKEEKQFS